MMSLKSAIVFCFFILSSAIYAQEKEFKSGRVFAMVKEELVRDFREGVFNDKLKEMGITTHKCLINKFKKAYPVKNSSSYKKLCATYELYFNNNLSVLYQVDLLSSSNLFSVVEPAYNFSVLSDGYLPNDPLADSTLSANTGMPQLILHDFYKAWTIQQGDTNLVIGVVDTGINFDQEDLKANLSFNYNDPVDGINNDGDVLDGDSLLDDIPLVDNFRGWDLGDNDNDPSESNGGKHGTEMTSIIAASPNNDTGMVGVAYNCKYLPIKASRDVAPNNLNQGYVGMILAAEQGAKVVNCSWGTTTKLNQIFELITTALTLDFDIVIVSAAGNEGNEKNYYPASFPLVISVGGMDYDSSKTASSNYNYEVDLQAAGFTRVANGDQINTYRIENGTSGAAAVVSGLTGLVRSQLPKLKAVQIKKHLEITGDYVDTIQSILPFADKVGRRINPYNALVDTLKPGLEPFNFIVNNGVKEVNNEGDMVTLDFDLVNLLKPSENVSYTFTALTNNFSVLEQTGFFPDLATWDTVSISDRIHLEIFASTDTVVEYVLKIEMQDNKGYRDREVVRFSLAPVTITNVSHVLKSKSTLNVFPNPFTDELYIENNRPIHTLKFFTLNGEELDVNVTTENNSIGVKPKQTLRQGVYFLELTTDEGVFLNKVIKVNQ